MTTMTTIQDIEQQLVLLQAQAKTIGFELVAGLQSAKAIAIADAINSNDTVWGELDDAKNCAADELFGLDGEQFELYVTVLQL